MRELVHAARSAGMRLDPIPRRSRLLEEEATYLSRFAAKKASQPRLTERTYKPDPGGRISLQDYDRLDQKYAEKLLAWGYLPTRKELKSFPSRSWTGIIRHHRRLETLRAKLERESAALQRRNGTTFASRSNSPTMHPALDVKPAKTLPIAVASPVVSEIKRQLDARRHRRELDPESKPEGVGIKVAAPAPDSIPTSGGCGNAALEELQLILRAFGPKDHPILFGSLAAVLELDRRIARVSSGDMDRKKFTEPALRRLMGLVCEGKFGLFAYHDVSNTLRSAARRNSLRSSPIAIKNALTNLRPMHTGLLTDTGNSRFVFWQVEKDGSQLAVVTFRAMSDWVRGISLGQFVPLRGRLITVSRHTDLSTIDREDAQFLAEAALKLRKGIHVRHVASVAPHKNDHNYLDGRTTSVQPDLKYKPHSGWLIPVVVEDGVATAGLEDGFFSSHGGRSGHEVRSFMRRAPGTAWNAPKTVLVSAHTRGGYDVGDIGSMPTVTIMREMDGPSMYGTPTATPTDRHRRY